MSKKDAVRRTADNPEVAMPKQKTAAKTVMTVAPRMLWCHAADHPGATHPEKMLQAVMHYENKYGLVPNIITVHDGVSDETVEELTLPGITVVKEANCPSGHYIITSDGSASNQETQ